jgi:hypothetical protein
MNEKIYLFLILFFLMLTSCRTYKEKITINGTPNTEIFTPDKEKLGVIPNSGKLNLKLDGDKYFAYLFSKDVSSDTYVPFALDFKEHNYSGCRVLEGAMGSIAFLSSVAALVGGVAVMTGSEEFAPVGCVGGGLALVSACVGIGATTRKNTTSHKYNFRYLKNQYINNDLKFEKPVIEYKDTKQERKVSANSSTSRLKVSRQKTGDYAEKVSGEYTGTGLLKKGLGIVEKYPSLSIKIEKVDEKNVTVAVYTASGDPIFDESSTYSVSKGKNGTYTLVHESIKNATITITSAGKLTYVHPKVEVDGDVYSLTISTK